MECSDPSDSDVSAANGKTPATTRNYKMPKRPKRFRRANYGDNSKKQRTGAAAASAPTAAAVPTPSPANRGRERQINPSQQIQRLTKKAEGLFDECGKLKGQLEESETETIRLQQQVLELQQQLKDQESANKREVDALKASHKVAIDKKDKQYEAQQKRYRTKLSSTVDHATSKIEEAEAMKSDAEKTARSAKLELDRVIQNERASNAEAIKRTKEQFRSRLMDFAHIVTKDISSLKERTGASTEREQELEELVDELETKLNALQQREPATERELHLEKLVEQLKAQLKALQPNVIQKKWIKNPNGKKGGTQAWPHHVVLLIMEWLSNRTPPSCIAANIVSMCANIMPASTDTIVRELPTTPYIRTVRSLLVVVTKTLAAYTVAKVPRIYQIFTDGTSRRQTEINNMLIGYVTPAGVLKITTLDNTILSKDKKSLTTAQALLQSMTQAQKLLQGWIDVTKELYPDDEVVSLIPLPEEATLTKARDAYITTDTCNQAKNVRNEMIKAIKDLAVQKGICNSPDEFAVFELDCWNHLRNLWIEHAVDTLEKHVKINLAEDLLDIPSIYRVDVDMNMLLRALDKEVALTANYAKGHGLVFEHHMETKHPGALLFPTARMLGGTRQDAVTEGSLPAFMNRHYYVEFLHLQLCAGTSEANILQTSLWLQLTSIQFVAMLRVLSIVHIAIVQPIRYLSGKCHDLDGWSISKMPTALDLLYDALKEIVADGSKLLDEDFAMGIFKSIESQVPKFKDYMTHMHEQKEMYVVGDRTKDSRKVGMEETRMELFTPTRTMNRQTTQYSRKQAEIIAAGMIDVLTNPKMTTKDYLSAADGQYSMKNQSEARAAASEKLAATNDASEGGHAASTAALKTCGTIRLDHAGAEGQSRANNDFGRQHKLLVASRKKTSEDENNNNDLGTFHGLHEKLQRSLIAFAQRQKDASRKHFDDLLLEQKKAAKMKDELALRKKLDNEKKQFVTNLYLWEEYNKPRCWRDVATAQEEYNKLPSNSAKMREVRNQILIRYCGLGWDEAYHPWSKDRRQYTHAELFDHLINKVIPLSQTKTVPDSPPFKLPDLPAPAQLSLGQLTHDRVSLENKALEGADEFKEQGRKERDELEMKGHGCRYEEWQRTSMPTIDYTFMNFQIEFLFDVSYDHSHDNESELVWMSGEVIEIVNAKKNKVKIRWDEKWLTEGEDPESVQVLLKSLWNPKQAKAGAWRQLLVE